jgi:hypothetical protein
LEELLRKIVAGVVIEEHAIAGELFWITAGYDVDE